MGIMDRLRSAFLPAPPPGVDNFWPYLNFNGNVYPFGLSTTMMSSKEEEIGTSFGSLVTGAYKSNAAVFACMLTRLMIFSEARFIWQRMTGGVPGDLWGNAALSLLEHPWPGATTGDLLTAMIVDADLAGNAFMTRIGNRIVRMRPDWVSIIVGNAADPELDSWDLDVQPLGYVYHPGGKSSNRAPKVLLPEQVAHFKPVEDPEARYRGMSWLTPLVREVMADNAATSHKLKFFENGATPNLVIKRDDSPDRAVFDEWKGMMERGHTGVANAYRTLYLTAGADATPIGTNMQQMDFKVTQGAGETRIAAASGMHPVIVGLSEGLQGSALNAGNFESARRLVADKIMRPLWHNAAGSLEMLMPPPSGSRLWYDDRDIAFLREDKKVAADIQQVKAQTVRTLIDGGFKADSVLAAVAAENLSLLKGQHTGLFSVQLQAPGSTRMPVGEVPGQTPVEGPGTKPETIPAGAESTKPVTGKGAAAPANGKAAPAAKKP